MPATTEARKAVFSSLALFSLGSRMPSARWAEANMVQEHGKPYNTRSYPHFAAPNGPFDAVDDPRITTIWLMFGSQLGKTLFGQTVCAYYAHQAPCPMMFASADEKLAEEGTARFYDCLGKVRVLKDRLPVPHKRKRKLVNLKTCKMYVAWPRSVSTMSDKAVKVAHGAEFDKWERRKTSREAHPTKLFTDRGKSFQHSKKFIIESTPSVTGESQIESGYLMSDMRKYYVPCPKCGEYQILIFGKGTEPFGLKWLKDAAGHHHHALAFDTAYYECAHCQGRIENYERRPMMQKGVWVPAGCQVDQQHAAEWFAGKSDSAKSRDPEAARYGLKLVTGKPSQMSHDAGYHLSTLYALSLHWGHIAEEFVKGFQDPMSHRNFVNQWLALTWERLARAQTWEQLGERLIAVGSEECPQGTVPDWACLLTCGVDKQADHLVFVVKAWGPDKRHHTLDYGTLAGFDELRNHVLIKMYPTKASGESLPIVLTLIDRNFLPDMVDEFCQEAGQNGVWILGCRGTDRLINCPIKNDVVKAGPRAGRPIVWVESFSTQSWMDRALFDLKQTDKARMSLFSETLVRHKHYLQQLLNQTVKTDSSRPGKREEKWGPIVGSIGDDYRDAERYAYGAMFLATYGGQIRAGEKMTQAGLRQQPDGPRIIGTFGR